MNTFRTIFCLTLLAAVAITSAQAQSNPFLQKLVGKWTIEGRQYLGSGNTMEFTGRTEWLPAHNGRYLHEQFEFDAGGRTLQGESFIGYSRSNSRFEYAQMDGFNPGMLVLFGQTEGENELIMETLDEVRPRMRWVYRLDADGVLLVELYQASRTDGEWNLASDYTYRRSS